MKFPRNAATKSHQASSTPEACLSRETLAACAAWLSSGERSAAGHTIRGGADRKAHKLQWIVRMLGLTSAAATAAALHAGCAADLDGSGVIDGADLASLLSNWGNAGTGDVNGSGAVDAEDLAVMLSAWGACSVGTPIETDLAAVSVAVFPYAVPFNSYNLTDTVRVAVDPARFPSVAGTTVDAWIVENRTAAQWAANTTLVDVRGAAQAITLPTSSTAFAVALTTTGIVGSTGLSPGRGFDLVIDADRDGVLSGGDLIDGSTDASGFWLVKDLALAGPYATTSIASYDVNDADIIDTMELERIYYPTAIATLGVRPLVVISHGNGHNYAWYDYLGTHLASWGYVVMSHQNDTVPGIETASTTTLEHTESFLAQLGTIGGGVLNGRVDGDRIVWIGHSRGGEGVARGYDRLFDGTFTSPNYQTSDIKLVISIAPTDFLGTASANPHGVPYMLLYGSADGDVCGCPDSDVPDSFNLLERAEGLRQSTYVYGADHNDFNCCGFDDFAGPAGTAVGRPEAQDVAKASILAMIRRVIEGDLSTEEYLWRQIESLRTPSIAATTNIVNEWKPAPADLVVVDNFQTNTSTATSSSGGAVALSGVASPSEGIQNDNNTAFTWATTDPFNGATRGRTTDTTRASVFDWTAASSIQWTVTAAQRDFRVGRYISLRASQGTRHPNTIASLADLTFTVVLVDETGTESAVSITAFAGGVEEPYQRTGYGTGTGWQNAMEAIRIPLTSFTAGGRTIDLSRVASIIVRFGGTNGSSQGRLVIDDLQLERN